MGWNGPREWSRGLGALWLLRRPRRRPRSPRASSILSSHPGERDRGNAQGQNKLCVLSAIDVARSPSVLSVCNAAPFDSKLEGNEEQKAAALNSSKNGSDLPLRVERTSGNSQGDAAAGASFQVETSSRRCSRLHLLSSVAPVTAGGRKAEEEECHREEGPAPAAPQPLGTSSRQETTGSHCCSCFCRLSAGSKGPVP